MKRNRTPMIAFSRLIEGYDDLFKKKHEDGWDVWFCTVQCHHLRWTQARTIEIMQKEVQRIYGRLLTNVFRSPQNIESDKLPILIGVPDKPVAKRSPTTRLAEVVPNDGIHFHFVLLLPPNKRLKIPLDRHVGENIQVYLGNQRQVSKFEVHRFVPSPKKSIADYLFKHVKRTTFSQDDVLILPQSWSELSTQTKRRQKQPAPHELRIEFRRWLSANGEKLARGKAIRIRDTLPDKFLLLSIVPHRNRPLSRRRKLSISGAQVDRSAFSATLIIPGLGKIITSVAGFHQVMFELEAAFVKLVIRDRQSQSTPTFAGIDHFLQRLVPSGER